MAHGQEGAHEDQRDHHADVELRARPRPPHIALELLERGQQIAVPGAVRPEDAEAIKDFPEQNLYIPINDAREQVPGAGTTYYELLHGIVQHDVYHAGQIAVLKRGF